jgi:hypothetical protein
MQTYRKHIISHDYYYQIMAHEICDVGAIP